jgi:predicted glycoside hydrolase/deacetylase ChbG (UPF0249 family)
MAASRRLIVNADDFGQSPGVNRGIIEAREKGIVTSTSMMVRWPAVTEAAAYAKENPDFSIGLHLDLAEWTCRDYRWIPVYQVVDPNDPKAVAEEVERQLAAFRRLLGRDPTHLDSHQHLHQEEPVLSVLLGIAQNLKAPLRHFCAEVQYCGDFYGQYGKGVSYPEGIEVANLVRILNQLPEGCTELACHPGLGNDLNTLYGPERETEVRTLCDPQVRTVIDANGIRLCSFADFTISHNSPTNS